MRLEEKYIKFGYFWLPENQQNSIAGVLSIYDGGRAELEIMGNFDEDKGIGFICEHEDFRLKRIIGCVEDDKLVTLENCIYLKKSFGFGNITKSKILANKVLTGAKWAADEVITLNTFSFSVDCLDEWVGISGIHVEYDSENRIANFSYNKPEEIKFVLDNGMEVEINFNYTFSILTHLTEAKITQNAHFTLKSEALRNLNDFITIASKITNLMCFAMDEVVTIKNVSATSSEKLNDLGKDKYPTKIKLFYQAIPFTETVPKKDGFKDMVFNFEIIRNNVQEVFNNWINAYEFLSPAFSLYFSTQRGDQKYLNGKFLALVQGLETYHRRTSDEKLMENEVFESLVSKILGTCPEEHLKWLKGRLMHGNEITLSKRLKMLIEPFKNFLGTNNERHKLLRQIVDTRNYLTHYDENLKDKLVTGRDLWILCLKMEVIFQFHFLHVIGFTTEDIKKTVENCTKLQNKIEEIKKKDKAQ